MELIKMNITNERIEQLKEVAREFSMMGVVAGGAVLDAMLDRDAKDIDVFYTHELQHFKDTFVHTVEANGTIFHCIGGGRYSDVAFAMSGQIEMLGRSLQIEIINKDHKATHQTLCHSLRKLKGQSVIERGFEVLDQEDFYFYKQDALFKQAYTLGNLEEMNRAYGSLLIHEFDLDYKQVMVDPVSLDIMATPAFVEAFTNNTVNFSRALIHGEGVTRRNLVRIADAVNKYGLQLADPEKVSFMLNALRDYHSTFATDMDDTTLIKRFAKNLGMPFYVTDVSKSLYHDMTDMVTDVSAHLSSLHPLTIQAGEGLDFVSVGIHFFDEWSRAMFRNDGSQIPLNESFGKFNQSLSAEIDFLISHLELFAGKELGQFIEGIQRSRTLFDQMGPRIIKDVNRSHMKINMINGVDITDSIKIAFDGYAPCEANFTMDAEDYGLKNAIQDVKRTLVTTSAGYVAYTLHSAALQNKRRKSIRTEMSSRYNFGSSLEKKVILFTLFRGKMSFSDLETFEVARYLSLREGSKSEVRTMLPVVSLDQEMARKKAERDSFIVALPTSTSLTAGPLPALDQAIFSSREEVEQIASAFPVSDWRTDELPPLRSVLDEMLDFNEFEREQEREEYERENSFGFDQPF